MSTGDKMDATKQCQNCQRDFSVFIRPYSCELCNTHHLCSNCAIKFVLSYEPNPSFLRLCNQCCDKMSRGNQLGASSKLSKPSSGGGGGGLWSFASSLISRPSHRKPPIAMQSKAQSIHISDISAPSHSQPPSLPSCIFCCSSQNTKSTQNTIPAYSYPLQDQAPMIPEAFTISTPNRKAKHHKLIEQHRRLRHDGSADHDPAGNDGDANDENVDGDDDDDDDEVYDCDDDYVHYLTMHPLNNANLTTPKSILCASMNQVALNLSINHSGTQHLMGELTRSSTALCDCYGGYLQQQQQQQIEHQQMFVASPQSAVPSKSDENGAHDDDVDDGDRNGLCGQEEAIDEKRNMSCYSVSIAIKHRKFKSLRIELLFDTNGHDTVAANVVLYDRNLRLWSGTQIVRIERHDEYNIITDLSIDCYQTVHKKCVHIVGSMAWKTAADEETTTTTVYPYRDSNVSTMVAALTQQRFDLIESYESVIQHRNGVQKNLFKPVVGDTSLAQARSDEADKNGAMNDFLDGGSKIPTKRKNVNSSKCNNNNVSNNNNNKTAVTHTMSTSVEQMEQTMLQHEIARIDSMIFGLERVLSVLHNQDASGVSIFDEATASVNSSNMFETNEIRDVKLQIANHLKLNANDNVEHTEREHMACAFTQDAKNLFEIANGNKSLSTVNTMPICLLCQRCSKTILLCEPL